MTAVKVFQEQKENPEIVYNNTYQKIIISSSFCRKSGDWTKSKSGDHVKPYDYSISNASPRNPTDTLWNYLHHNHYYHNTSTTMPRNSHGHLTYNFHTTATTTTSAQTITMPYKPIYSPIKHRLSYYHKQPNSSGITKRTTNEPFTTMVSEWLFKITFSFHQQYNSIPIESTIIILVISF